MLAALLLTRYDKSDQKAAQKAPSTPATSERMTRVFLRLPIPVVDTAFSPYYLGVDDGYFARHGLNVRIEPGNPELNPVKMVSQGTDEFGVLGGPELLLSARSQNAPLVGLVLVHADSDFVVLLSLADGGSKTVAELQGKKVGFYYGHVSTDIIRMLLNKEGVTVTEVDVGFDYGQLLNGTLAAQWAFRTTAGIALPARGIEVNVISPASYGIHTDGHVLVTSEKMIRENPDVVQRFVNAVLDGMKHSAADPGRAIEVTMNREPSFSRDVGQQQMAIYGPAIKRTSPLGALTEEKLDRAAAQMKAIGILPPTFDLHGAANSTFVERYARSH